jgi:hypothetical protein
MLFEPGLAYINLAIDRFFGFEATKVFKSDEAYFQT